MSTDQATWRRGTPTFDVVVVVDWSASSVPTTGRDSIWVAVRHGTTVELRNPSTRREAGELLQATIDRHREERILIGVDVGLGCPAGSARAALGEGPATQPSWRRWWQHLDAHLTDDATNANNRFAVAAGLNERISAGPGPFWGVTTTSAAGPHLQRTKAPGFPHRSERGIVLPEFRVVEFVLRRSGRRPASVWQLAGAGSVGSQSLTFIPVLEALRRRAESASRLHVWPFETGFAAVPCPTLHNAVVIAEVWPTLVELPDPAPHPVRDATQVLVLSEVLAAADREEQLGRWFDPGVPPAEHGRIVDEEGWVLGVEWPTDGGAGLRSPG